MTHPTFTGTHFHDPRHGMTPAILLGTLFRPEENGGKQQRG